MLELPARVFGYAGILGKVEFKWKRNRLFDQQAAVVVYEVCLQNPEATVTAVINKPTTKWYCQVSTSL